MKIKRLLVGAVPTALFLALSFGASTLYAAHSGLVTDEMQMDGDSDPTTSLAPFDTAPNDFDDVCDEAGPCTGTGTTNSLGSRFTEDAGTSGFAAGAAVQSGADTTMFEGGDKDLDPISDWGCVAKNTPQTKTNLIASQSAVYSAADNGHEDLIIFAASQLEQQQGTSTFGFWLFQDDQVDCNAAGTGVFTGQKTVGDILLVADVQGSTNAVLSAFYWMDDPGNPGEFCLGDDTTCEVPAFEGFTCDTYTAGDALCADFNIDPISTAWGTSPPNSYLEMGVNLTELIPEGVCISKAMVMGRTSTSRSAQIKDYILNDFNTCGSLEVKKVANEAGTFSFTAEPDPDTGNPSLSFDLATGESMLFPTVESGDYKITETALPADWAIADIECVSNGKPPVSGNLATGEVDITLGIVDHMVCTYTNTMPSIIIDKLTNGFDGLTLVIGDPVTWTYKVTNTSEVALSNVVVTDDKGVIVTCPKTTLAAGEAMTCTANGTAIAGPYANIGTVTGDYEAITVTDSDPSNYVGKLGGIDIEKATNGEDADTPTGPMIAVGSAVNWTYVVKNTGDLELSNVVVTDDKGVIVTCPKTTLTIAEEMTCFAKGTATAGQYANLGSVSATDAEQRAHGDSDPSHYFGVDARIDIEKATNGEDADSPTGPRVFVGTSINWTYVVRNTGNVALTGVKVSDNKVSVSNCPKTTLAAGESMTCSASGTAQLGQYENTATVTGTSPVGTVSDMDKSHYYAVPIPVSAEPVPTLTEWMLILLAGLLAFFAVPALRRS